MAVVVHRWPIMEKIIEDGRVRNEENGANGAAISLNHTVTAPCLTFQAYLSQERKGQLRE
jgi:hypothetical protein